MSDTPEHGPVYGVELPTEFTLVPPMRQACPGASELERRNKARNEKGGDT